MKKWIILMMMALALTVSACGAEETAASAQQQAPATVEAVSQSAPSSLARDDMPWPQVENAVTAEIGLNDDQAHSITLYDNDAAMSLLYYLGSGEMRFPSYTYEEQGGFVAQRVRGEYTRDDEMTIADVQAGELYLFSDNMLRLYFKDVPGANIVATPVGYFADEGVVEQEVPKAYQENLDDVWGVSVYFLIERTGE